MSDGNITFSELTVDEIQQAIYDGARKGIEKIEPRLRQLEKRFKFMAPTFDRETAAEYCNKGVMWIDKQRKKNNLPTVYVGDGSGHPRIKKEDLDHLLCGGRFDENGNKLGTKKKTA